MVWRVKKNKDLQSSSGKLIIDEDLKNILAVLLTKNKSGFKKIHPIKEYHTSDDKEKYKDVILKELSKGKIIIIDLSLGDDNIKQFFMTH